MRRGALVFILINALVIFFLVRSVFTLLTLLVEDASTDAIHRSDIPSPNSSLIDTRPRIIPKIIHQTYRNNSIPKHWQVAQQSCLDLHPDYEYILWTDEKARAFMAKEYPWFLDTYDSYLYDIQRADSLRYFLLAHFGGTYIDLDDVREFSRLPWASEQVQFELTYLQGCNRRLDPLLAYPAWVRRTVPTGISNDAMGAVPQHPFFLQVIDSLQSYDRTWVLPYITVMYSTGPLFLSVIWKEYMRSGPSGLRRVRVLLQDEYNRFPWSFFIRHRGNSWHGRDAQLIFWIGRYWMVFTILGFALALLVGFCLWWIYCRLLSVGAQYRYRYLRPRPLISPSSSPKQRASLVISALRSRIDSKKLDEETGAVPDSYFTPTDRQY